MVSKSKGSNGTKGKLDLYGGFSFITLRLSSDDKAWLEAADCPNEFPPAQIFDLAMEGYKFTIKEDQKNNTFVASLADVREGSETYKRILSGRGSTPLNAWHALAYRHTVVLQGDWSSVSDDQRISNYD